MPDDLPLRPATDEEIEEALAFALRFDGRKRVHHGDEFMARITAERLLGHLEPLGVRRDEKAGHQAAQHPVGRAYPAAASAEAESPTGSRSLSPTESRKAIASA